MVMLLKRSCLLQQTVTTHHKTSRFTSSVMARIVLSRLLNTKANGSKNIHDGRWLNARRKSPCDRACRPVWKVDGRLSWQRMDNAAVDA